MRKKTFFPFRFTVIVMLLVSIVFISAATNPPAPPDAEVFVPSSGTEEYERVPLAFPAVYKTVDTCGINEGDLVLVNYEHEFSGEDASSFIFLSAICDDTYTCSSTQRLDSDAAEALKNMMADYALSGENKKLSINSAYRSFETQVAVYIEYVAEYGQERADELVAFPGYSEHQTGLAVDITNSEYLAANCVKSGFIRRYTEDKEEITKITNEKWHYRYVGIPHAAVMYRYNFCLEEYLDFIRHFSVDDPFIIDCDGDMYLIYFVKDGSVAEIREGTSLYSVSGNNFDGYIITAVYGH